MAILTKITLITDFAGQANEVVPRICRLYCPDNTLSDVTTAAALDLYLNSSGHTLMSTDIVATVASNGTQFYKPVFTAGSCQLTALP